MAADQKQQYQHQQADEEGGGSGKYSECLKNFLSACARNISVSTKAALLAEPSSSSDDIGLESLPMTSPEGDPERNPQGKPPGTCEVRRTSRFLT